MTFEGFHLSDQLSVRHYLHELIGMTFEATINKKNKTIRYQNYDLFVRLIDKNAAKIN